MKTHVSNGQRQLMHPNSFHCAPTMCFMERFDGRPAQRPVFRELLFYEGGMWAVHRETGSIPEFHWENVHWLLSCPGGRGSVRDSDASGLQGKSGSRGWNRSPQPGGHEPSSRGYPEWLISDSEAYPALGRLSSGVFVARSRNHSA